MMGIAKLSRPRAMKMRTFRVLLRLRLPRSTCTCDRGEPLLDPYRVLAPEAFSTGVGLLCIGASSPCDMHLPLFRRKNTPLGSVVSARSRSPNLPETFSTPEIGGEKRAKLCPAGQTDASVP